MILSLRPGQHYRLSMTTATVATFFLIVSTAPIVESVFSQSKSKGRQQASRPSGKVSQHPTGQPTDFIDVPWELIARDKLFFLTAKEAPELMEALNKAPEIDCQIENDPNCPVTILSARRKGIKVDWVFQEEEMLNDEPDFLLDGVELSHRYLVIKDTVTLKNKTNQPIASLSLYWDREVRVFWGEAARQTNQQIATFDSGDFRFWPDAIQPNSTATQAFGACCSVNWGRPSIKVQGAEFKNGRVWGEHPSIPSAVPPPPPPPPPPPGTGLTEIGLIRRSEQELRASAVNSIELNKRQPLEVAGDRAIVQLIIAPTGSVVCAIYLSGPESMRKPVIEAAQQWRFKPTPGMAVAGIININPN